MEVTMPVIVEWSAAAMGWLMLYGFWSYLFG
jgi:hypothetical protein